jgi:hypothetical protein
MENYSVSRVVEFNLSEIGQRGRKPKYPWKKWFDGRNHVLIQGEDYEAESPKSFRSTVYSAARRMGVDVETAILEYEETGRPELFVQAKNPDPPNGRPRKPSRKSPG